MILFLQVCPLHGEIVLQAAAGKAGNLKQVEYADYKRLLVLGFFGRTTVTAYGDRK